MRSNLVDITLIKVRELDKSIVFKETEQDDTFVLPKSQIEIETTKKEGVVVVTMPEWLAKEKELI